MDVAMDSLFGQPLFIATSPMDHQKWSPRDKMAASRLLYLPRLLQYQMSCLPPQSVSLALEPDSVYLVFIMRGGHPCPGVFHHNSDNSGILAYADGRIPGPQRSRCKVFSFELKNSKARISNPTCA